MARVRVISNSKQLKFPNLRCVGGAKNVQAHAGGRNWREALDSLVPNGTAAEDRVPVLAVPCQRMVVRGDRVRRLLLAACNGESKPGTQSVEP
jgi:hypothetical protein